MDEGIVTRLLHQQDHVCGQQVALPLYADQSCQDDAKGQEVVCGHADKRGCVCEVVGANEEAWACGVGSEAVVPSTPNQHGFDCVLQSVKCDVYVSKIQGNQGA